VTAGLSASLHQHGHSASSQRSTAQHSMEPGDAFFAAPSALVPPWPGPCAARRTRAQPVIPCDALAAHSRPILPPQLRPFYQTAIQQQQSIAERHPTLLVPPPLLRRRPAPASPQPRLAARGRPRPSCLPLALPHPELIRAALHLPPCNAAVHPPGPHPPENLPSAAFYAIAHPPTVSLPPSITSLACPLPTCRVPGPCTSFAGIFPVSFRSYLQPSCFAAAGTAM
jgi:hypothetical protein